MTKPRFNWFLLLRLAGIALFIIVLSRTDLKELWGWMKQVDRMDLLLAIFFQFIVLIVKAWRWYLLNEGGFSISRLARRAGEFFEGYAVGVITPGRVGELMKAGHAGTRTGILGAGLRVIAERGMDLSIFIVIAGIAITNSVLPGLGSGWGWITLLAGIAGMLLSVLILVTPAVVRFAERMMRFLRLLGKEKKLGFISHHPANAAGFLGWSLVSNLSYFACCYFLAIGVGMDVTLVSVGGGVATAGVVNTIPVTIMGLGTREVTFLYVFSKFPQAQVLAFSGLVFLVAQIGGGLISLLMGQILLFKFKVQSSKFRDQSLKFKFDYKPMTKHQ